MTAAILLASYGVRVTVVEKNATTADDPKAISLDDESLRAYQRAGISDDVLGVIVPGTGTTYYGADGEELFHGGATVPFRFGFPFKNPFAQPDLERVLRESLERHPLVDLKFSTELIDLVESADGVRATVCEDDESTELVADFLLGADGGRSKVRSVLGIGMSGRSHDDVWLVIDCLDDMHSERYGMHHGDPRRPHVIVPGLHGRCRYEFLLHPGEGGATSSPPFDLIERLLSPYRPIRPDQVERAVAYRFHGLSADVWQRGRSFLLGDAAHMMPPFAGQGLNSGIRDAVNLTWKLAAVIQDQAGPRILETYEQERRPHAEAVIRSSERLGRVVMTTNRRLAEFRDSVVRRAMRTDAGRSFFEGMQYRPSPRLAGGLVIDPPSNPLIGLAIGQPNVFDFTAHQVVPFDAMIGRGWSVIGVGIGADPEHAAWSEVIAASAPLSAALVDVPLDDLVFDRPADVRVAIDVDQRLYQEMKPASGRFIVVRPDRIVASVVAPEDVRELLDQLLQLAAWPSAIPATA